MDEIIDNAELLNIVALALMIVFFPIWVITFFFFGRIRAQYYVEGHRLEIFSGFRDNYIKINGEMVDHIIHWRTAVPAPLTLQHKYNDAQIIVRITSNFWGFPIVTTKVNDSSIEQYRRR
ncbi:MAG: hypothetical protein FWE31_04150 [Firmicutes bacterium]|nr:hypothetical protein [Bacillota bacterium]